LPGVVGEGGVLIRPHADIDAWQKAVESLYQDASRYAKLSQIARANAETFVLDRTLQSFDALVAELNYRGRHCA